MLTIVAKVLHHRLLIGFLNTSHGNTVQNTFKGGHFFVDVIIIWSLMLRNVGVKKVFSLGVSLTVKQQSSILNMYMFKMKTNLKNSFNLQE